MDSKAIELIAIGASITAHCQPCLTYHVDRAREMGIEEQDIREAVAVGQKVEKGSMSAMRDFTGNLLDSPAQSSSTCRADEVPPKGENYCS